MGLISLCVILGACNAPWNQASNPASVIESTADPGELGQEPMTRAQFIFQVVPHVFGSTYQPPPASGDVFSDLDGHWAEDTIEAFASAGYIAGYPDGTFQPDRFISRAEATVVLLKAKHGPGYTPPSPNGGAFADIDGHWAQAWVEALISEGVITSDPNSNFRPADEITQRDALGWIIVMFSE
jgi:hypothetical protein